MKDQSSITAKPGVSFCGTFGPHMAVTVHLFGHRIQSDPSKLRETQCCARLQTISGVVQETDGLLHFFHGSGKALQHDTRSRWHMVLLARARSLVNVRVLSLLFLYKVVWLGKRCTLTIQVL